MMGLAVEVAVEVEVVVAFWHYEEFDYRGLHKQPLNHVEQRAANVNCPMRVKHVFAGKSGTKYLRQQGITNDPDKSCGPVTMMLLMRGPGTNNMTAGNFRLPTSLPKPQSTTPLYSVG